MATCVMKPVWLTVVTSRQRSLAQEWYEVICFCIHWTEVTALPSYHVNMAFSANELSQ